MKKILIIEDNKQLAGTMESVLKMNNYEPELISDFDNLFSVLEEKKADLIISDYYLGNYTGCDIIDKLNEMGKSEIPVVLVSGTDDENIYDNCKQRGAEQFIKKPFSLKEFIGIVKSIFERRNNE